MHERLINRLLAQRERIATRSDIAFAEKIAPLVLEVAAIYQDPETDVKLSLVDKKGALDILLDDKDLGLDVGTEVGAVAWWTGELGCACGAAILGGLHIVTLLDGGVTNLFGA